MSVNFVCNAFESKVPMCMSWAIFSGFGEPEVGAGWGGLALASLRNVEATENCPSRRKCMAMARLIKAGCEASSSHSLGSSMALKFYSFSISILKRGTEWLLTLSRAFWYLPIPE